MEAAFCSRSTLCWYVVPEWYKPQRAVSCTKRMCGLCQWVGAPRYQAHRIHIEQSNLFGWMPLGAGWTTLYFKTGQWPEKGIIKESKTWSMDYFMELLKVWKVLHQNWRYYLQGCVVVIVILVVGIFELHATRSTSTSGTISQSDVGSKSMTIQSLVMSVGNGKSKKRRRGNTKTPISPLETQLPTCSNPNSRCPCHVWVMSPCQLPLEPWVVPRGTPSHKP